MAKYDVSVIGNQLVVTLVVIAGDFDPNLRSFKNPSIKLASNSIKILESGIYKMALNFDDINQIQEVFPTDLENAADLINALISTLATPVSGPLTNSELRASAVPISPRPNTTGFNGTTPYKLISLATTNASIVKSSGGNLYSIVAIGLTSTVRYLKLYNKATAPTVGTDVPVMTIPIPANTQGAGISIPFSMGVNFPIGISLAITGTAVDNGTTAIGAGDVIINLTYA
jgi:hypothetical protein